MSALFDRVFISVLDKIEALGKITLDDFPLSWHFQEFRNDAIMRRKKIKNKMYRMMS